MRVQRERVVRTVKEAENFPRGVLARKFEFLERPFEHAGDGRARRKLMVVVNAIEGNGDTNVTATMTMNVAAVVNPTVAEAVVMLLGSVLVLNGEVELVMAIRRNGFEQLFDCCIVFNFDELRVVMTVRVNVDFYFVWHV